MGASFLGYPSSPPQHKRQEKKEGIPAGAPSEATKKGEKQDTPMRLCLFLFRGPHQTTHQWLSCWFKGHQPFSGVPDFGNTHMVKRISSPDPACKVAKASGWFPPRPQTKKQQKLTWRSCRFSSRFNQKPTNKRTSRGLPVGVSFVSTHPKKKKRRQKKKRKKKKQKQKIKKKKKNKKKKNKKKQGGENKSHPTGLAQVLGIEVLQLQLHAPLLQHVLHLRGREPPAEVVARPPPPPSFGAALKGEKITRRGQSGSILVGGPEKN